MDSTGRHNCGDPFNIVDMMNFDGYFGWCNNSFASADELLPSYGSSSLQSISTHVSYDHLNFYEENALLPVAETVANHGIMGNPFNYVDKVSNVQIDGSAITPMDFSNSNDSDGIQNSTTLVQHSGIPRLLGQTLAEKMLWALSLLKESCSGGILAQVWVPVRKGNQYVLSTYEQPFLLDQVLAGYREVSRSYTFSIEQTPGSFPGLPGRVFISKIPEWTSNVNYYNKAEYLRINDAVEHEVRGSVAVPIFSSSNISCCAVLELVTTRAKPDFDLEIDNVCRALQAVNLKTSGTLKLEHKSLSLSQKSALSEITNVLRAVCHAHRVPLAQVWIPCILKVGLEGEVTVRVRDCHHRSEKAILFILENACYVIDRDLQGFVHACVRHPIEEGQGVAGKALQSNLPFFFHDVKTYHISEYPPVHHARKFGLNAAVAIRLRSLKTGDDDYILEFFLPLNMTGTKEQQLFLDNLSSTMQRICKTLRTVSDSELIGSEGCGSYKEGNSPSFAPISVSTTSLETSDLPKGLHNQMADKCNANNEHCEKKTSYEHIEQGKVVSMRLMEKKRTAAEKTVSLSVLQQYFAGSLKDAAKSIGVCPTTLKRICRQHGISRWPSRKINKVNRSLRKIQTVLDSVQGVEGGLKFDPTTCEIVTTGSISPELCPHKSEIGSVKLEEKQFTYTRSPAGVGEFLASNPTNPLSYCEHSNLSSKKPEISIVTSREQQSMEGDGAIAEHEERSNSSSMAESSNGSGTMSSSPSTDKRSQLKVKANEPGFMVAKVTCKEDMVRFKFDPSAGYVFLNEEIAKRFRLQSMSFQLKYLDDDEEWVLLQSDQDLQECLEIMDLVGMQCMKIVVCDRASRMGSSESSNCFLSGSS